MEQNTAETATAAIEATTAGDATATAVVEAKPKRQKKWTKEYEREYMRNYMRERWRRVNGVTPDRYQEERRLNLLREAESKGPAAVEFYNFLVEHNKMLNRNSNKKRKTLPTEMVVCPICMCEHRNTPGMKKMHERTVRHKLAVEFNEKRAQAERGEP